MADTPKRPPTPQRIVDWARSLQNGYQGDAADYQRDPSAGHCHVCEARMIMLANLADAVAEHMPQLWPSLRLVSRGAIWHATPGFDWDAAERELRTIEAAALSSRVTSGGQDAGKGMAWEKAAARLERLRKQGEPFTSQAKLAEAFGCSPGTINKAIHNTDSLHEWAKRRPEPRAQSLNAPVTDQTSQSRELDPAEGAAIREFVEGADPETKAWFLALSPDDQIRYLDDPEKHLHDPGKPDRLLGRKP